VVARKSHLGLVSIATGSQVRYGPAVGPAERGGGVFAASSCVAFTLVGCHGVACAESADG
jgi:hypothetical protein